MTNMAPYGVHPSESLNKTRWAPTMKGRCRRELRRFQRKAARQAAEAELAKELFQLEMAEAWLQGEDNEPYDPFDDFDFCDDPFPYPKIINLENWWFGPD